MRDIVFVGGIHGVGKSTFCSKVCNEVSRVHLKASELLKWEEISDADNKEVGDIQYTQNRLINGLNNVFKKDESYLIDGHYCLFGLDGRIENVPVSTFKEINPKMLIIVTLNPKIIKERLEKRDKKKYELNHIDKLQRAELKHANHISKTLEVPLIEIKDEEYSPIINLL